MMKKILLSSVMSLIMLVGFTSCEEERTVYSGSQYIMFSDTLTVLGVEDKEEYLDVYISATRPMSEDQTLAVEVVEQESSAIEGLHYELESNTVVIKACELTTSVRIRGYYENLTIDEVPEIKLRLISPEETHWNLYEDMGLETKVMLQKIYPFDIHDFTGYAWITSTYLYNYVGDYNRLIKTSVDETDEERRTIIMHDLYYDGYDVKLRFTTDDPLNPLVKMDDQPLVTTGEAFGTKYGDGMLHLYQPSNYVSYYSSGETFVYQYITLWVPGMAAGTNTVGTFVHVIKWISDDEARILQNQGY